MAGRVNPAGPGGDPEPVDRPVTAEELVDVHGDLQDEYLSERTRNYGRWKFDDHIIDGFVYIANKPRWLASATIGVLVGCGLAYAVVEEEGPIEGLWWAVVTGFTVGYGDQYPVNTIGRLIGTILIVSMFVLAMCLGAQITSRLIEDRDEFTHGEQEQIKRRLANLDTVDDHVLAVVQDIQAQVARLDRADAEVLRALAELRVLLDERSAVVSAPAPEDPGTAEHRKAPS